MYIWEFRVCAHAQCHKHYAFSQSRIDTGGPADIMALITGRNAATTAIRHVLPQLQRHWRSILNTNMISCSRSQCKWELWQFSQASKCKNFLTLQTLTYRFTSLGKLNYMAVLRFFIPKLNSIQTFVWPVLYVYHVYYSQAQQPHYWYV